MHLKALRTRLGITQQQLADKLSTSQQTIARWESGRSAIPTKHLKDLAVLLGCSIPDLLGVDSKGRFRREKESHTKDQSSTMLYGTVSVSFGRKESDNHAWPISEGERSSVLQQVARLNDSDAGSATNWLSFQTLDDRIVFANVDVLDSITLVSDDAEEAPAYVPGEIYQTIRELIFDDRPTQQELDREDAPYSKQLLDTCEKLIAEWGGDDGAYDHMEKALIERVDGSRAYLGIEDDGIADIAITILDQTASYRFAKFDSEGSHRVSFHRLGALRLIEMSLAKWKEMTDEE